MEIRVLLAFLLCLGLQVALWLDGPSLIETTLGKVEQPYTLVLLFHVLIGALESVLLLIYFLSERAILAGAISDHIGGIERAILLLFSRYPDQQIEALEVLSGEEGRRYGVYRSGLARAAKFFAIGMLLGLGLLAVLGATVASGFGGAP